MHIAINSLFLIPGEVGGTETYLREILAALVELPGICKVTVITQRENHDWFRAQYGHTDKVDLVKLDFAALSRTRRILAEQLELPRVVRRCGAELLWSPGYTAPLRRLACPQVVTIHDMQYRRFPEDLSWSFRMASELLIPPAARRCDRVVTDSDFGKQEAVTFCGVPASKVSVVPAGCNAEFGTPMLDEQCDGLLAGSDLMPREFILCVAHTHPHKRVHELVEAFGDLERDDLKLVLVGHPRRGEALVQQAIADRQLAGRVVRLHGLDSNVLLALYQSCAAFALPSQYEGFGLPVLEAMLAGVPVVTTRAASIPEIGGECVVYADDGPASLLEGLRTVLAWSPEVRDVKTRAAQARAGEFTWQRAGEQLYGVFRDVLSQRD
jgi:glycosyltransferase involved in cell wall biosynthesis